VRGFVNWNFRDKIVLLPPLLVSLAGCAPGIFLAESGPTRGAIVTGASLAAPATDQNSRAKYVIIPVNEAVTTRLNALDAEAPPSVGDNVPATGTIGIGDIVGLTIFESDSGGLFLPREAGSRAGNYVTLPPQQVGSDGTISVPYVGSIRAAGSTTAELRKDIESRLATRAVEPQAIVTITDRRSRPVSVLGDVQRSEVFALGPGGETVLGAIAKAGGPKSPAFESIVTLQRAGRSQRVLLGDIARNPGLNFQLRPGDAIFVSYRPRYFLAMGAIGQSSSLGPVDRRVSFQDGDLTLVDALGRAGGLNDDRANAHAVFVFRFEQRDTLEALRVARAAELPAVVPTVYLVDLIDPAGFFDASRFHVHSEDVVYVANAPATDLQKFLVTLLGAGGQSAAVGAAAVAAGR
jgi:polysaccharide export outer membrane protein